MKKIFPVVFFLTTLLILSLRFYKLGNIPQGLNIDEASYGYDAYSILKTGKDQWGNKLPLTLKSFNDYKPAGLSYAIIPAIKLFGLNTKSVRFPSAIFGLLTLPILYLTLNKLQKNKYLNLLLVTIYALSPWTYGISRMFYEPNIGLFAISLSTYLLLRSYDEKNQRLVFPAFALLAISGYFYAALRYVSLIIISLFVFIWNIDRKKINFFFKQFLLYAAIILPLFPVMFSSVGLKRLTQEKELLKFGHELIINENRKMCFLVSDKNDQVTNLCYILWNKPILSLTTTFNAWASHLSPEYLFFSGTHPDIIPNNQGAYPSWLLPFYLIGIISLAFRSHKKDKSSLFLLLAILLSPLPAALAQATRIHRNVVGLYLVFICISIGIQATQKYLSKTNKFTHILFSLSLLFVGIFTSMQYLAYYHITYTHTQPEVWNYDSEEIYKFIIDKEDDYDTIIDTVFVDGPLYYAFYNQIDPAYFQRSIVRRDPNKENWIHNDYLGVIRNGGPTVRDLLCVKHESRGVDINTLIISSPITRYGKYALLQTRSFDQKDIFHEIYDIDNLYEKLSQEGYNFTDLCPIIN